LGANPVAAKEPTKQKGRRRAASRRYRTCTNIESAGLTLDRYSHIYGSDVEAVGVAINAL
jgi:hypothetical protein